MSRRKEAMCSILGTEEVPPPENYPTTITLPARVHELMVGALAKTSGDGRERSMRIGYRNSQWTGGIAMRGTTTKYSESSYQARSNRLHSAACAFYPTQLYFHTHPTQPKPYLDGLIDDAFDRLEEKFDRAERSKLTTEERAEHHTAILELWRTRDRIPSSPDVSSSLKFPPMATVGMLLASEAGNFVWLRRNTNPRNPFKPAAGETYSQGRLAAQQAQSQIKKSDQKISLNIDDPASLATNIHLLETSRAAALSSMYVSYASTNPLSPELHKIIVEPAATPR